MLWSRVRALEALPLMPELSRRAPDATPAVPEAS